MDSLANNKDGSRQMNELHGNSSLDISSEQHFTYNKQVEKFIKKNGLQQYLDLLQSSPSHIAEAMSKTSFSSSECEEPNSEYPSINLNRRLSTGRDIMNQMESNPSNRTESIDQYKPVHDTDQYSVSSLDLYPNRELSLLNQFSSRFEDDEVKTSVTVVLGNKMARNITFSKPRPLCFEVLRRLNEILTPEDFEKCNLPTKSGNIKLRRKSFPLQGTDELEDGDVIYATGQIMKEETIANEDSQKIYNLSESYTIKNNQPTCTADSEDKIKSPSTLPVTPTTENETSIPIVHIWKSQKKVIRDCDDDSGEDISVFLLNNVEDIKLRRQIADLRNANSVMKLKNSKLRKDFREALRERSLNRWELHRMRSTVKSRKLNASNQRVVHCELMNRHQSLVHSKSKLEGKVRKLEGELENITKTENLKVMGVALPKNVPSDPIKLEEALVSLQNLEAKLSSLQIKLFKSLVTCTICLDKPRDSVIVPCGHSFCSICAPQITKCPICRQLIQQWLKIY